MPNFLLVFRHHISQAILHVIDAHNHLLDARLGSPHQQIDSMRAAGITHAVVNSTEPREWRPLRALAAEFPDFITPAYGIHPWKISHATGDWLDELREILDSNPRATLGEIGLDRWVRPSTIAAQIPVFLAQFDLATELARPVTIHCLKAASDLQALLQTKSSLSRVLLHSFQGNREILSWFAQKGAYFSLSGYVLDSRKSAWRDALATLPPDRVLLESDAPDMLPPAEFLPTNAETAHNEPKNLAHFAPELARIWNLPREKFLTLTTTNALRWLGRTNES